MNLDWIEHTAVRIASAAAANFAGEELNIDSLIIGNDVGGNNEYVRTLKESAYLYTAQELGDMAVETVTGSQAQSPRKLFSMSMLEAFLGSTMAYYLMKKTGVATRIAQQFDARTFIVFPLAWPRLVMSGAA